MLLWHAIVFFTRSHYLLPPIPCVLTSHCRFLFVHGCQACKSPLLRTMHAHSRIISAPFFDVAWLLRSGNLLCVDLNWHDDQRTMTNERHNISNVLEYKTTKTQKLHKHDDASQLLLNQPFTVVCGGAPVFDFSVLDPSNLF